LPVVCFPGREALAVNAVTAGRDVIPIRPSLPTRLKPAGDLLLGVKVELIFSISRLELLTHRGLAWPNAHDLYLALMEGEENGAIQHSR
jgi:hypothetical protein